MRIESKPNWNRQNESHGKYARTVPHWGKQEEKKKYIYDSSYFVWDARAVGARRAHSKCTFTHSERVDFCDRGKSKCFAVRRKRDGACDTYSHWRTQSTRLQLHTKRNWNEFDFFSFSFIFFSFCVNSEVGTKISESFICSFQLSSDCIYVFAIYSHEIEVRIRTRAARRNTKWQMTNDGWLNNSFFANILID